ncbi:MAG: hypothetical protein ACOYCD_03425 [Kiritimatiellia bacterium]|jgi:hypothetical protein
MNDFNRNASYMRLFIYFFPLALHVVLQSLTYPLLAIIASRGEGGALNTTGLAQCRVITELFGALPNGLITAGMVYARTHAGYHRLREVNYWVCAGMTLIYIFMVIPSVSHFFFNVLMGLPSSVATPAKRALLFSYPQTLIFFLRTPYVVMLFIRGAGNQVLLSGILRILFTLLLTAFLCQVGAVGIFWAVFCLTAAIGIEALMLRYFAVRHVWYLPTGDVPPRRREIFSFSMTLSIGNAMLSLAEFMLGAFIARAPNPEQMLPVYYVVLTAVSTIAFSTSRIQTMTLAFYGKSSLGNRRIFIFTLVTGITIGLSHLILLHPVLLNWYYIGLQNLCPADLPLVKITSWAMVLFAPSLALRAYAEGLAAYHKKPMVVLMGQVVCPVTIAVVAFFALNIRVPGNLIGPLALFAANMLGALVIFLAMHWERRTDLPAPETKLSQNPCTFSG